MKNLFLFCFPRSFSNQTYEICRRSLHSMHTFDVPGGEVLNLSEDVFKDRRRWFSRCDLHYQRCKKKLLTLDQESGCRKHIIKDVDQPFLVQRFFNEFPNYANVLHVRRPLADVAYCLWSRSWWTPLLSYQKYDRLYIEHKEGYLKKDELIDPLAYTIVRQWKEVYSKIKNVVDYKIAIQDKNHIFDVLESLGYNPDRFNYIDSEFQIKKQKVRKYKYHSNWVRMNDSINKWAEKLNVTDYPKR